MISLFEKQVRTHAQKPALTEPGGRIVTFAELELNARRIAAKLISDGFAKGDTAVITAARGIGFIEAVFGILIAGGAYVPLSEHYPESRINYIMNDCVSEMTI